MDVLSDVLRTIRLQGALFLNAEFQEPWCVDAPGGGDLARVLLPGARHLAICHLVVEGQCWIRLHDGEPIRLQAGDVATLPHGDPHLVGSGPQHAPVDLDHVVQLRVPELARLRYGGDGDRTILVCGWFAYERELNNPLIATLPRLLHTALTRRPAGPWIEQSIRYALQDAASGNPGSGAMGARLAELMFLEALRGYIESLPALETGWLAGLRDPLVGRCLMLMHEAPARDWTLAGLATAAHSSRSVIAQRFNEQVGVPPMQYLKRWRLAVAARQLRSGSANLARVAESIGYESESAFNRAFRHEFGVSPGAWRRAAPG